MQSQSKIPGSYFADINELIQKFTLKGKRPGLADLQKNKVGGLIQHDFKTYFKAK